MIAPARVVKASANARFILNADQVYDKKNNLTWARCSLGQTWDSYMGCVGVVKQWNFDQVQARLDDGWRVPTHAELLTLIDPAGKTSRLPIDVISFPNLDADKLVYWSVEEEDNSFAWAVIFIENGINASLYRSHRYAIRLVRSGK